MKAVLSSMLVALATTLAVGGMAVASASAAAPELSPTPEGGSEGDPSAGFTSTGGRMTFETAGGSEWNYNHSSGGVEIEGRKNVRVPFFYFSEGSQRCYTRESKLVMEGLQGHIGYASKAKNEVGLLLEPVAGGPVAKCEKPAESGREEYTGSVIAHIGPVNTLTNEFYLSYSKSGSNSCRTSWKAKKRCTS